MESTKSGLEGMAKRLVTLRIEHGFTQEQVATKVGAHQPAVSCWESGDAIPKLEIACRLCQLFNVGLDELCGLVR